MSNYSLDNIDKKRINKKLSGNALLRKQGGELQKTYPELESWQNRFVAIVWQKYCCFLGREVSEEDMSSRDEDFPKFIIKLCEERMIALGEWK
ncbi:hypothetical protein [Pectobacterium brasiliense]|uniref:hypothetical protein n=1 Tax=Pectobacterium brasiliense TaxID=180957 RepID=UPI001968BF17|nr:hypothetical protein [Pectobacterium brasiliense]MBN3262956.1 hypothetical protein [Pectobacterium brasiliense]